MAKKATEAPVRRAGTTPLRGRPLDDNGAIEFLPGTVTTIAASDDEDEVAVAAVGRAVIDLFRGLAKFFTQARALEQSALQTLDTAKLLTVPESSKDDEELQRFIQRTTADRKTVEDHWRITATITAFRNRLTSRRAKSTDALESANKIGNRLHTAWVENERRREEQAERQRQAEIEERQRKVRERELQDLEDAALAREQASVDLSGREQLFVEAMARTGDGVRAAREAGFKDPAKASGRLLQTAKITAAIQQLQEAAALRRQKSALTRQPLDVVSEPAAVISRVTRATGVSERTFHYGDVVNAELLLAAVLDGVRDGSHAIPTDILQINQSKVNEYAKSLEGRIALWPGVKYRREGKVI